MSKDTGESAFPKAGLDPWGAAKSLNTGMTLRDYFAAKAMDALAGKYGADGCAMCADCAADAYALADAMMRERSK